MDVFVSFPHFTPYNLSEENRDLEREREEERGDDYDANKRNLSRIGGFAQIYEKKKKEEKGEGFWFSVPGECFRRILRVSFLFVLVDWRNRIWEYPPETLMNPRGMESTGRKIRRFTVCLQVVDEVNFRMHCLQVLWPTLTSIPRKERKRVVSTITFWNVFGENEVEITSIDIWKTGSKSEKQTICSKCQWHCQWQLFTDDNQGKKGWMGVEMTKFIRDETHDHLALSHARATAVCVSTEGTLVKEKRERVWKRWR